MKRRLFVAVLSLCAITGCVAADPARAANPPKRHKVAFQVDQNDAEVMNHVLNNIQNMFAYYKERGEPIEIELVAFGAGLHMLRADTSPVKQRIAEAHATYPTLIFSACQNSRRAMAREEGKEIPILPEARMVPSGVVRLSELQEQGFTYLRP